MRDNKVAVPADRPCGVTSLNHLGRWFRELTQIRSLFGVNPSAKPVSTHYVHYFTPLNPQCKCPLKGLVAQAAEVQAIVADFEGMMNASDNGVAD